MRRFMRRKLQMTWRKCHSAACRARGGEARATRSQINSCDRSRHIFERSGAGLASSNATDDFPSSGFRSARSPPWSNPLFRDPLPSCCVPSFGSWFWSGRLGLGLAGDFVLRHAPGAGRIRLASDPGGLGTDCAMACPGRAGKSATPSRGAGQPAVGHFAASTFPRCGRDEAARLSARFLVA